MADLDLPLARPALKEWAAAVAALLDGRQTILLRKGGIHEKRFALPATTDPTAGPEAAAFPLFPTTAHAHAERVRPEFRDLVSATASDSTPDQVVVRAMVRVTAVIEVHRPERLAALEEFHLWTTESVRIDRLDFRPRHRLAVVVVQAHSIAPVVVPRTPAHGGCRSWLDLDAVTGPVGPAVLPREELDAVAEQVREVVGPRRSGARS